MREIEILILCLVGGFCCCFVFTLWDTGMVSLIHFLDHSWLQHSFQDLLVYKYIDSWRERESISVCTYTQRHTWKHTHNACFHYQARTAKYLKWGLWNEGKQAFIETSRTRLVPRDVWRHYFHCSHYVLIGMDWSPYFLHLLMNGTSQKS